MESAKTQRELEDKVLYVIYEETCFKITEKVSDQEEADTRTFLHALHAAHAGYNAVVITTVIETSSFCVLA